MSRSNDRSRQTRTHPAHRHPRQTERPNRVAHFIDFENLVGPTNDVSVLRRYIRLTQLRPTDHIVVGVGHSKVAVAAHRAFSSGRLVFRPGCDGADLALLDHAASERQMLIDRFSTVVIGSGDGIFSDLCRTLRSSGLRVLVASNPTALSRNLERSATAVIRLTRTPAATSAQRGASTPVALSRG